MVILGNGAAGNGGIRDQYSMEYNNTAFDTKENWNKNHDIHFIYAGRDIL